MPFEFRRLSISIALCLSMASHSPSAVAQYVKESERIANEARLRADNEDQYYKDLVGRKFWYQPGKYMRAGFYSTYARFTNGEYYLSTDEKFTPVQTVGFVIDEFVPNRARGNSSPRHIFKVIIDDGTVAFMKADDFGSFSMKEHEHMYFTDSAHAVLPRLKETNALLLTRPPEEILADYERQKREEALAEEESKRIAAEKRRLDTLAYEKQIAALEAAAKANKRKGGVRIGMSVKQVLQSSWGKPDDINRTTTANTVSEQWVYGNASYLYFTNGKLTAIQN